jgi:hypothetical protein
MVSNIWSKYLPVIKILLKRSKQGEQKLAINQTDFQRAGLARKTGNKFSIIFKNGKVENVVITSPVAAELAASLLHDETTKALLQQHDYRIAMDTKYQLHIEQLDASEQDEAEGVHLNHA